MPEKKPPEKKPAEKPKTVEQRVVAVLAKQLKLDEKDLTPKEWRVVDLDATASGQAAQRKALEKEFQFKIPAEAFKKLRTVGDAIHYVQETVDKRDRDRQKNPPAPAKDYLPKAVSCAVRPDRPQP